VDVLYSPLVSASVRPFSLFDIGSVWVCFSYVHKQAKGSGAEKDKDVCSDNVLATRILEVKGRKQANQEHKTQGFDC